MSNRLHNQSFRKKTTQIAEHINELIAGISPENVKEYYAKFFKDIKKLIDFEHATIFYIDKESLKPEMIASTTQQIPLINGISLKDVYKNIVSNNDKKRILVLKGPNSITTLQEINRGLKEYNINSYMSLLLVLNFKNLGILNFAHSKKGAFTEEEILKIYSITPLIEAIISKNIYIQKIEEQKLKIAELQKRIIDTQENLVEAEMKIAVSATITSLNHEINNPLMIISGYVQLLEEKLAGDIDAEKKMEIITSQIDRIMKILARLRQLEDPLFEKYINESDVHSILKLT